MTVDLIKETKNGTITFYDITHSTPKKATQKPASYVINRYLSGLYKLKQDIIQSDNPDKFLIEFSNDSCMICKKNGYPSEECEVTQIFVSPKDAVNRLYTFQNGLFGKIIDKLSNLNFEILIGGSTGLASVLRTKTNSNKFKFEPKDMDIYVKNISDEKIKKINGKIYETFPDQQYNIYIVRRPLTLTWWIFDKCDKFITEIQLNMLQIRSFAEPFIVYHSDAVSIGYEIKNQRFVALEQRWNNFIKKFPNTFMTNLNSYDNKVTLLGAANKYSLRGFSVRTLMIYDNIENKFNNVQSQLRMSDGTDGNNLIDKFVCAYRTCPDIIISSNVGLMYNPKQGFPPLINIRDINECHEFFKYVSDFEYPDGYECFINYEKHEYVVANTNCMHDISFKAFILMGKFRACPICRKDFNPVVYKINDNRTETIKAFMKKSNKKISARGHQISDDLYFGYVENSSNNGKSKKIIKSESDSESDVAPIRDAAILRKATFNKKYEDSEEELSDEEEPKVMPAKKTSSVKSYEDSEEELSEEEPIKESKKVMPAKKTSSVKNYEESEEELSEEEEPIKVPKKVMPVKKTSSVKSYDSSEEELFDEEPIKIPTIKSYEDTISKPHLVYDSSDIEELSSQYVSKREVKTSYINELERRRSRNRPIGYSDDNDRDLQIALQLSLNPQNDVINNQNSNDLDMNTKNDISKSKHIDMVSESETDDESLDDKVDNMYEIIKAETKAHENISNDLIKRLSDQIDNEKKEIKDDTKTSEIKLLGSIAKGFVDFLLNGTSSDKNKSDDKNKS